MSLRDLYQEIIVDHAKEPRNFGKLDKASHCQVGHNPLCGDKLVIYLIEQNGIVENLQFEGAGCAISLASASLMTEAVKGKSIEEVKKLFGHFHNLLTEGKEPEFDLGKLAVFSGVAEFPVRVKCATLAWHTLNAALSNDPNPVSTE
jgi:nitrogen fixation NifU-like protein